MRFANADGRAALLVGDQVYDLHELSGGSVPWWPMEALVAHWERILDLHEAGAYTNGKPVTSVTLGPPVTRPSSVYAIGINYKAHAAETGAEIRPIPAVFTKFPSSITGPYDDVVIPRGEGTTDWEAEVAFVVGEGGRHISARTAMESLRGLMCAQDISERFVQYAANRQFSLGKSYDTFCPLGPCLVTIDELPNPLDLHITCKVNGQVMQDSSTTDMIVDVPHLVELLSSVMTLRTGDVCLTGTPAGVGMARKPPVYLRPGDVIETEIEGLGTLRNACVAEA
jgi:2-keto-4-pentenoate hydratase/2-oxohepta-3-ene-1,7-dioic acid hydratase in catechol pathway